MKIKIKKCSGECGEVKPLELFGNNKNKKDGKQTLCKECFKIYAKKNVKAIAIRQKDYREKHHDFLCQQKREHRERNKDEINANRREQYRVDGDKQRAANKKWKKENEERYKEVVKAHRLNNLETTKKAIKEWKLNNKDAVNASVAKRRAAKLQRTVAWANDQAIKDVYSDCEEINLAAKTAGCTETFVVDHVIPLLGTNVSGLHIASNLQIITAKENGEKSNNFTPGIML